MNQRTFLIANTLNTLNNAEPMEPEVKDKLKAVLDKLTTPELFLLEYQVSCLSENRHDD